jgi:hypothetical protein
MDDEIIVEHEKESQEVIQNKLIDLQMKINLIVFQMKEVLNKKKILYKINLQKLLSEVIRRL